MPLIYRNAGAWGPGKGARLTSLEADGNVHNLNSRMRNLEDNRPEAIGIDQFSVSGNALTIVLTNGSIHGPFTLPSASWRWAGEWQPLTPYYKLDLVAQGGSIYLVQHNHSSHATFAADAEDIEGFRYACLLSPPDQPYDIGMFYGSVIPGGGSLLLQHVATRSFLLPVGFADSTAFLLTPVDTESIALPIHKNGALIGHIEFNVGEGLVGTDEGQLGTFVGVTPAAEVHFERIDRLTVHASDVADGIAADLSITFAARTGTI